MATSGPSEPWRNAEDFAECVAKGGRNDDHNKNNATATTAPTLKTVPPTPSWTGNISRGELKEALNMTAAAAATSAAAAATPSSPPLALTRPPSCYGAGFGPGERKGGALFEEGDGTYLCGVGGSERDNMHGGRNGGYGGLGGGGVAIDGYKPFDSSIGVDLGSV